VNGSSNQTLHVCRLRRTQSLTEWLSIKYRLNGCLGHEQGFGVALSQSSFVRFTPIARGQYQAKDQHRDEQDDRKGCKKPHR
jgi:hypothetical protein